MRIRHVTQHYILKDTSHFARKVIQGDLPPSVYGLWLRWGLGRVSHAVIATHKGSLVGFFRFFRRGPHHLRAQGTWVAKSYRRQGLAMRLWGAALRKFSPCSVSVTTSSPGGRSLVRAIQEAFPDVVFKGMDYGQRSRSLATS